MIEISNLQKNFGKLKALNSVSVGFGEGEVAMLIGPNGSGKTTLIKCLLGMVIPDSGEILFNKTSVLREFEYRAQFGYMPQIGRYPENMRIGQLFDMMKSLRPKQKNYDEELIHEFGLDKMQMKKLGTLSGGTRQKVSAALAFLFEPKVLILDEPTAGLDPLATFHLKEKILRFRKSGGLVLITSHNLSEVEELANRIIFLVDGHLKFAVTMDEMLTQTKQNKAGAALAEMLKGYAYE